MANLNQERGDQDVGVSRRALRLVGFTLRELAGADPARHIVNEALQLGRIDIGVLFFDGLNCTVEAMTASDTLPKVRCARCGRRFVDPTGKWKAPVYRAGRP